MFATYMGIALIVTIRMCWVYYKKQAIEIPNHPAKSMGIRFLLAYTWPLTLLYLPCYYTGKVINYIRYTRRIRRDNDD